MNAAASFQLSAISTRPEQRGRRWLWIVVLIAVVAAAVAVVPSLHAQEKHGAEASQARQCLDGEHQVFKFHNATTNRTGIVCDVGGMFGVVIIDELGNEVTSFLKNKMSRFEQVLKYMRNAGYELIQ